MEHEIHVIDGIEMMEPGSAPASGEEALAKLRELMNAGQLDTVLDELRAAFERDLRGSGGAPERELDLDLERAAGRHFGSDGGLT